MYFTESLLRFKALILISIILPNTITAEESISPEALAEKYPYVVALLNSTREYVCTGTIFSPNTVLTSGHCIEREPSFVAVGLAVLSDQSNNNSIFAISAVELHLDYVFEVRRPASNLTTYRLHSNIGVAVVNGSKLTMYIYPPAFRHVGTEEMKHKSWTIVGYGRSEKNPNMFTLRQEEYTWTSCLSRKWYYCVCGTESSLSQNETFGEGAPLILDDQYLLAVTALPCGALKLSKNGMGYNIFTVVTPYIGWIKRSQFFDRRDVKVELRQSVMANAADCKRNLVALCIILILFRLYNVPE